MAKETLVGWLHDPLTAVLGTRGKVAALRVLWRADAAIPYREVVRRSGMAYRSIDLALGELAEVGIVEQLPEGRERRVRLCAGHRLAPAIATLMQVEADFFAGLRVELRTVAEASRRDGLLGAAIVGAAARGEERLGRPLEIVVFATDAAAMAKCRAAFAGATAAIASRYGVVLRLTLYDLVSARAMWRTRTAAAERSVRESELLTGSALGELLAG
jgi:DNA-binding transcriptional ArsR family regulator